MKRSETPKAGGSRELPAFRCCPCSAVLTSANHPLVGLTTRPAYHAADLDRYQYTTVLLIENYWLIPALVLLLSVVIVAWVRKSAERVAYSHF